MQIVESVKAIKTMDLAKEGKFEKAFELCDKEIERKPLNAENYHLRAALYQITGKHKEALKDLDSAFLIDSANFNYLVKAQSLSELGNFKEAISCINKQLKRNGESPSIYISLANVLFNKEEYQSAFEKCTEGLSKYPDNSRLYNFRGYTSMELKNFREAITDFDKAIELDEFNEMAFNNRGFCKYNLGFYELAKEDVLISLEANSGNALAHRNMGLIEIKLNNKVEGCAALHKAIELGYLDLYGVDINVDIIIYCN